MAKYVINNGGAAAAIRAGMNSNFDELYADTLISLKKGASNVAATKLGYLVTPEYTGSGNTEEDFEVSNLGNPTGSTEDRTSVPVGILRGAGSGLFYRNVKWNHASSRWEYVLSTASAYGSAWAEPGGEGFNIMAAPVGVHPYAMPTGGMNFSVRATGLRSVTGYTAGYVNQTMGPIGGVYESAASGLGQWNPATSAEPIFFAMSEEAKGSDNEYYKAETNASSTSAWPGYYFAKSRGTYGTKTAVVADDIGGRLGWKFYDGNSYEITSVIQSVAKGTIADGNAGASMQFLTSATNTAGLTKVLELMDGAQIGFYGVTPIARAVVPTGSSTDTVITALQNLGLISQS